MMKLSKDKELTKDIGILIGNFDKVGQEHVNTILNNIDMYLEKHGFHIYPVKKEKAVGKEKYPNSTGFKEGDLVEINDETHPLHGTVGKVLDWGSFAISIEVVSQRLVIPNEFLKAHEVAKEKGTVSFKEVGEKPSADGEEALDNIHPSYKFWVERARECGDFGDWNTKKLEAVKFTPFQRCPVCEGEGEKEVVVRSSEGMSKYMKPCPCCEGSMVIPMKVDRR